MATHVVLDNAAVTVDDVDLDCYTNHIELAPDVATQDATTFCGVIEYPGAVKWYFRLTLYQSFEAEGTFATLRAALQKYRTSGTPIDYKARAYRDRAISVTNPSFEGKVVPKPFAFLSGDAGALSEVDVEWTMTAEPTVVTTPASNGLRAGAA